MKLYRLIFVGKAFLLLVSIFLINHSITIGHIMKALGITCISVDLPNAISYTIYIVVPIFLTYLNHRRFPKLDHADIKEENVKLVESASAIFLPTFFGYVFVGLSISNYPTLVFAYIGSLSIFILLTGTILCYCAEIYLYNPIFHLLGYRFYFVTADKNKVLVMTKKDIKLGEQIEFKKLGQVNDFTYIDIEEPSKETEE